MKYLQKKSVIAVSAALALSACASTLLWTRIHQDDERSFASTLAVDAAGATYVGGGVLEAPAGDEEFAWWSNPGAVFSKYDSNGQRLWTHTLTDTGSIKSIHVLDEERLLVHVGSPFMNPEQADAVWIASSETGELITQLEAFSEEHPFADLEAATGKIYVAAEHRLTVFDYEGALQDSEEVTESIRDIEVADTGDIFLAVEYEQPSRSFQKRNTTLDLIWQTPTEDYPSLSFAFKALSDGGLIALTDSLTKYDAQGDVVFQNGLWDIGVMRDQFFRVPNFLGPALLQVDQAGDVYVAVTMTDFYNFRAPRSNMVTSATLAKFTGDTGQFLWKDNLSTLPISHPIDPTEPNQIITNANYWPASLSVTENGVKMVVNAMQGDYLAPGIDNPSAGCLEYSDFEGFPYFTCPLSTVNDAYSKVFTYDATSGKRLKKGEKLKGNVRAVAYSSTGEMHLVGDNANEADVAHYSHLNLQWLIGTEFEDAPLQKFLPGGSAYSPQSQLFVSKYK